MTNDTVYLSVKHIAMVCNKCRRTFYLIEEISHICPYCYLDDKRKLMSHHADEVAKLAKILADGNDEITKLKRSNASLKGVITKMRNKENQALPVQECGTDQYEVDLSDLGNYTVHYAEDGDECVYCDLGHRNMNLCESKGFNCIDVIAAMSYLKLKPHIKADLESGKAVAKGGGK